MGKPDAILIVEDQKTAAELLASILRDRGLHVTIARDVPSALIAAQILPIDCILSGIEMPQLGGLDLLRLLRTARIDTPLILVSFSAEDHRQVAMSDGAFAVLGRPVDFNELFPIISAAIAGFHEPRGRRQL